MKKRYIAGGLAALVLVGGALAAYTLAPTVHAGSTTELPELGRRGDYRIGTQEATVTLPDRPEITAISAITGNVEPAPRSLRVRLWYPTAATEGNIASYQHDISRKPDSPLPVSFQGLAIEDAAPMAESKFPLVVMSHGYGGWAEHFSFLGEHIATRGYVVASIDHADARPDGAVSFITSFGNVLQNRALDQQQIIEHLIASPREGVATAINLDAIGVIGYSMGGYGALRSAGALYDYNGEGLSNMPDGSKQAMQDGLRQEPMIHAVVALAPWGGAPDNRAWNADGLANIQVPALIVAGNQDDVVDFDQGVSWLFDNTNGSDRQLLVYREARHNIVGNAITDPAFPANQDFATVEYIREPVWRTERLNAINQHFITAFLDLHLKGDAEKAAYLTPPTQDSNNSSWELSFGERLNGKLAGTEQTAHWRGFQNRWALGMEMKTKAKGE